MGNPIKCEHDKRKDRCKDCKGSAICEHDRIKRQCKECKGSAICEHDRIKRECKECSPNSNYFCHSCKLFGVKKQNNYLCSYCNPEKTVNRKTRENRVRDLLTKNEIKFIQDKTIQNTCCLKYRPDFVIDCNTYFIILECDEYAHKQYDTDCEVIRMNNISSIIGLPCKWIRYNPDKKGTRINKKEEELMKVLKENLNKEFIENLEVEYLFY